MNREEIKKILPHREPMLLLDEADTTSEGGATGKYTVRGDEFFLQGHYPGNPVMPGVIQCEILAQTCGVLMSFMDGVAGCTPFLTSLDKVKFRKPVLPGDTLETSCRITRNKGVFYFAEGEGRVNGELAVKCQFSFALVPEQH